MYCVVALLGLLSRSLAPWSRSTDVRGVRRERRRQAAQSDVGHFAGPAFVRHRERLARVTCGEGQLQLSRIRIGRGGDRVREEPCRRVLAPGDAVAERHELRHGELWRPRHGDREGAVGGLIGGRADSRAAHGGRANRERRAGRVRAAGLDWRRAALGRRPLPRDGNRFAGRRCGRLRRWTGERQLGRRRGRARRRVVARGGGQRHRQSEDPRTGASPLAHLFYDNPAVFRPTTAQGSPLTRLQPGELRDADVRAAIRDERHCLVRLIRHDS